MTKRRRGTGAGSNAWKSKPPPNAAKAWRFPAPKAGSAKIFTRVQKTKDKRQKVLKVVIDVAKQQDAPQEETKLVLSGVTQTASNAFTATFNEDASKTVTKDNLKVKSDDGLVEFTVKSVDFAADGKTATVTVDNNFVDGTTYNVTYDTAAISFTAKVGSVDSVVVGPASAPLNTATKIEIKLLDVSGIDVTPAIDVSQKCIVSVDGQYGTADISDAANAKITMKAVGDKATVKVTYNSGENGAKDVVGSVEINCVAAEAAVGSVAYKKHDDLSINSKAAKFYQDPQSETEIKVGVGADVTYDFCAIGKDGNVISYDYYEVESGNSNIANVSFTAPEDGASVKDSGKFACLKVDGVSVGTTSLNITAWKNDAASHYSIPVSTYEAGKAVRMESTIDLTRMSDADDEDYYATITSTLYDAADQKVAGKFDYEVLTKTDTDKKNISLGTKPDVERDSDGNVTDIEGIQTTQSTDGTVKVYANAASARNYTIRVNGADNLNYSGLSFDRNISLNVRELSKELTDISYQVEVKIIDGSSATGAVKTGNVAEVTTKDRVQTRLYATSNGLFAGYVDPNELDKLGGRNVASELRITSMAACAIYGNTLYSDSSELQVRKDGSNKEVVATDKTLEYKTVDNWFGDENIDNRPDGAGDVAKIGPYTARYTIELNDKVEKKTASFTVSNSYVTPTITRSANKVSVLDVDTIIEETLVSNVDMNNDNGGNAVINLVKESNGYEWLKAGNDVYEGYNGVENSRLVVRYAVVEDSVKGTTWYFYVPANTTYVYK